MQISHNATRQHFLIAPLEMQAHVRDKMIFIRAGDATDWITIRR